MGKRDGWMAALFLVGTMVIAGCGGGDTRDRAEVTGRVTLDGNPINEGAVNLIPVSGQGIRVGGPISDGVYRIPRERGPIPGKYRVEIYGFEPMAASAGGDAGDLDAASDTRQIIPPKFNAQSALELDVDGSNVEHDFELSSS